MIDWPRVNELRDEVGSEDFDEVVELFLEEVEEVINRLRQTPDRAQMEQDLHFLKGSAMSLGFERFSAFCQDGERELALGQADSVDLPKILDAFDRSKTQFIAQMSQKIVA